MAEVQMTDSASVLIPRYTGGMSSLSSIIIIYIILKSNANLSDIYHRIMFGMSIADILGSTAVALTTLPMPREGSEGVENGEFSLHEGTKLGNEATCKAQGFFVYFGFTCMFMYNGSLWVYYCCSIALKMKKCKLTKFVEPFLHLVPTLTAFFLSLQPFLSDDTAGYGVINERPYCTKLITKSRVFFFVPFIIILSLMSLLLILWRIWWVEKNAISRTTSPDDFEPYLQLRRNVRVILIQATAYILSYLATSSVVSIVVMLGLESNRSLVLLHLILFPLQGFFNFVIFVSHKIYSYTRLNGSHTYCALLLMIFCGRNAADPILLTRLSLIQEDREAAIMGSQVNDDPDNLGRPRRSGGEYGVVVNDDMNNDKNNDKNSSTSHISKEQPDSKSGLFLHVGSAGNLEGKTHNVDDSHPPHHGDLSGFDIPSFQSTSNGDKEM